MKLKVLSVLALAAALASCATDPTWERVRPREHMVTAANGCPVITIDDAAPLSQWKKVGEFWDQDSCQGTPFKQAEIEGRMAVSREDVRSRAAEGDQEAVNLTRCWDQKDYMSWTAPASSSLIGHKWNAIPYTCVEKDDPRLAGSGAAGSPQVAGK
jgi:hypothetical protein